MDIKQIWVGHTDLGGMLQSIGGWMVGCPAHNEAIQAVNYAKDHGYITTRIHYAPVIPEGREAFEVTDLGIEKLRQWWGPKVAEDAAKQRQWYRDNAAKYVDQQKMPSEGK